MQPIVQTQEINALIRSEVLELLCGASAQGGGHVSPIPGITQKSAAGKHDDSPPARRTATRSIAAEDVAGPPFPDRRGQPFEEQPARNAEAEQLHRAIRALQKNTQALEAEIARRKDAEAQLDRLIAHQDRMLEEERKRIARELHDELGSLLAGISAYMSVTIGRAERAGKTPEQELLVASELADLAVATVRRVVTELRPSVLDHLGVWSSLEWYAGQVQERSELKCECRIDPALRETELGSDLGTALFRIVQEALTNVARHAQASRVSIRATRDDDSVIVEIEDNGTGIDAERLLGRDSFGIAGMYERARQFGGDLKIGGANGQGTVVAMRFRLATDEPASQSNSAT